MSTRAVVVSVVVFAGLLGFACGSDDSSGGSGGTGNAAGGSGSSSMGGATNASGGVTSGGATGSGGESSAFAQVAKVFSQHCTGCHGATQTSRLVLVNDDMLYERLTTPLSATRCVGIKPVDTSDPTSSLLYQIVAGPIDFSAQSADCKLAQMPNGCMNDTCLVEAKRLTIQNWITSGAPRD